jgi:hypothetical protein
LEGVYWRAGSSVAGGFLLANPVEGEQVVIQDFVFEGLPNSALLDPTCGAGCGLVLRDGFASFADSPTSIGVGRFLSGSLALEAPLAGLAILNHRLLRCSSAWGESGANIGRNLVAGPVQGLPIVDAASCPLAAPQLVVETATPAYPYRSLVGGERFGPKGPVGLADPSEAAGAGLEGPFVLAAVACSDRIDNDGDGWIDAPADPGCAHGLARTEAPACDDGVDNDRDGRVDFPDDPQCGAASGGREHLPPAGCGLGFELAFLVPWLARRLAGPAARQPRASRRQA